MPTNKQMYKYDEFTLTLTVATSAYADGDVVGGLLSQTIMNRATSGFINKVSIVDDDEEGVALNLHVYNSAPSTIADNAAFAMSVTSAKAYAGYIAIATGDYTAGTGNKYAIVRTSGADDVQFDTPDGVLRFYLALNGAGVTFTAGTDLTVSVGVWYRQ